MPMHPQPPSVPNLSIRGLSPRGHATAEHQQAQSQPVIRSSSRATHGHRDEGNIQQWVAQEVRPQTAGTDRSGCSHVTSASVQSNLRLLFRGELGGDPSYQQQQLLLHQQAAPRPNYQIWRSNSAPSTPRSARSVHSGACSPRHFSTPRHDAAAYQRAHKGGNLQRVSGERDLQRSKRPATAGLSHEQMIDEARTRQAHNRQRARLKQLLQVMAQGETICADDLRRSAEMARVPLPDDLAAALAEVDGSRPVVWKAVCDAIEPPRVKSTPRVAALEQCAFETPV